MRVAIRRSTSLLAILAGCSLSTDSGPVRQLGQLMTDDYWPGQLTVEVAGRDVTVTVLTYGSSRVSVAETEVLVQGLDVLILPWDFDPGSIDRSLGVAVHTATISFPEPGTARIRAKGLNLDRNRVGEPDTLVHERDVVIE